MNIYHQTALAASLIFFPIWFWYAVQKFDDKEHDFLSVPIAVVFMTALSIMLVEGLVYAWHICHTTLE